MIRVLFSLILLVASLAAQQAPDRAAPPKLPPPAAFTPPQVQKRTLANGLPVWIVEQHRVPVAHVTIVVKSGASADPRQKFGLAHFTADMLDEGAGKRGALEIADAIDYLGAQLSTASSFDASYVDLHVPVARLGEALGVMADVVRRPTFPEKELQRVRDELLTSFVQAEDDPATLIGFAFPRMVYGSEHRYGTAALGTAAAAKTFSAADLEQFHARHYVPANAVAIVVGDVTPSAVVRQLDTAFGTWKNARPQPAAVPNAPQLRARQVFLVDKPGAAQSQIEIGWVGVPRSTPDYFAIRVLNTILGGAFTSRLNMNLREQHGYSYGAGSAFEMRKGAGPFSASAGVQTDKTAESLREFFKELEGIRKPIPDAEVDKARNYLALQLPAAFETTSGIAQALSTVFVHDLPPDYYATFTARVRAVTSADLQRVAERYVQPDKFAVVIVGDRKAIESKVAALNLGPLKVVPVHEVMR